MADPIADILGYDPENPFRGYSRLNFTEQGQTPNEDINYGLFGSGTSPRFNAERNRSRSTPANFQTSPSSGLYADTTAPFVEGSGMLPKPLADEVSRYNARTPTDLFLKGLTALSPIDILDLLRGTPSYKESDRLHSKKGRYKHLDEDPLSAPPVYKNLTSLPSEPSLGSSEQLRELLQRYGLTTDNDLPISELVSMFAAPTVAMKGLKAARQVPAMASDALSTTRRALTPNLYEKDLANRLMSNQYHSEYPVASTLEAVAPDLGQVSGKLGDIWKEDLTNKLIGGKGSPVDVSTMGGMPTTTRSGYGAWKDERNPLRAVYTEGMGDISQSPEFVKQMRQIGADLNQEGQAAHRFIPNAYDTGRMNASAALVKPSQGDMTPEQFTALQKVLGNDMVFTHNPELGGAVVMPFGKARRNMYQPELIQAEDAARKVLGDDTSITYGTSKLGRDRFFEMAPYEGVTPNPETTRLRNVARYLESNTFVPEKRDAPTGGVQAWSRGNEYPTSIEGQGTPTQWRPVNYRTGERGDLYGTYAEAEAKRAAMQEAMIRRLIDQVR